MMRPMGVPRVFIIAFFSQHQDFYGLGVPMAWSGMMAMALPFSGMRKAILLTSPTSQKMAEEDFGCL
jgi:hypothetical protein